MRLPKENGRLGFRDFFCINKALLAKQIWHLWNTIDSLIAKNIKAKYHSNDSILDASIGKKTSFTWRSIQSSIGLVQEGLIWRDGNSHIARI